MINISDTEMRQTQDILLTTLLDGLLVTNVYTSLVGQQCYLTNTSQRRDIYQICPFLRVCTTRTNGSRQSALPISYTTTVIDHVYYTSNWDTRKCQCIQDVFDTSYICFTEKCLLYVQWFPRHAFVAAIMIGILVKVENVLTYTEHGAVSVPRIAPCLPDIQNRKYDITWIISSYVYVK